MPKSFYLIAGEASGDALGARLIRQLRKEYPRCHIAGVGGERMAAEGLESLFPMREISLMGFIEILPHIPNVMRRLKQTLADIRRTQPDAVITIDAPGFNKRVAKGLQPQRVQGLRLIHYVAPTVWAYRPHRAEIFAGFFDHLLCLLPFEPPYFEKVGLKATFVGHPLVQDWETGQGQRYRKEHHIPAEAPVLCLLPGSRKGEIKRHLTVFRETVLQMAEDIGDLQTAMLIAPSVAKEIAPLIRDWPVPMTVEHDPMQKNHLFAASDFALAKSGTVALELAKAGVPHVVTYRVNPISAHMMRKMIRTRFVNLVNILAGYEVVPELLQELCRPELLAKELLFLANHPERRDWQVEQAHEQLRKLLPPRDISLKNVIGID